MIGKRQILNEISLELPTSQFHVFCGPNGSGKTTLLRALLGIQKPSSGSLFIDGKDATDIPPHDRQGLMAWVPAEQPMSFDYLGRDVISWRLPHKKADLKADQDADQEADQKAAKKIDEIISVLGIHKLLDQPLPKMSLGEQKQIHLARVMASRSTYLLLDEPTACLDPAVSLDFMAWIVRETSITKRTVIASLHDLTLAHEFAHTVTLLSDGRVADFGDPRKMFLNKSLRDILGVELTLSGVSFKR